MTIQPMKALTIYQPWASLIACGAKRYETRGWATSYRGPIAIHAGAKGMGEIIDMLDQGTLDAICRALTLKMPTNRRYDPDDLFSLPRGCIIATADLMECWEVRHINDNGDPFMTAADRDGAHFLTLTSREKHFGDFTPGRYAWEFANVKMLVEPIPVKGRQGLWNWEGVETQG